MAEGGAVNCHQVVAAIMIRTARVLLCHRSPDRAWYPGMWDLPGGHVAAGETPHHALGRELREELGIAITIPPEPEFTQLAAADFDCRIWIVTEWTGNPSNMSPQEHDDVAWWSLSALPSLQLAHPDYPAIVRRALT
jgi:8-oxo-dGTP diphosphatase